MKVKMITLMAGPQGVFHGGTIADFPEETAKQLIKYGYAEFFEQPKIDNGEVISGFVTFSSSGEKKEENPAPRFTKEEMVKKNHKRRRH